MRLEKTVLQVVPALDEGGAERTTVEIARAIIGAGGRALVASSGGRLVDEIKKAGGGFFEMPAHSKNPVSIMANRGRLIDLIKRERVDIVHARSRAPAWSALFAARASRVPLVTTYHGAYRAQSPLKKIYNSSMVRGDLVIANSEFTAAAIRSSYPKVKNMRVIPRGADLEEFNPLGIWESRISRLRNCWGLSGPPGGLILLLPGRLTDWKGHRLAIDAVAGLVKGTAAASGVSPPFQLIFAGDEEGRGKFARDLMRRVGELGLQEMVRWVGHCDDMPAAYLLADIILSPATRPEAFGRIAVEAGAMERVVIAADHGGARETVIDRETGFLAQPGSVESLASAILSASALGDSGRRAMGARARQWVARRFSTDAMTRATIEGYQDLLSGTSGVQ